MILSETFAPRSPRMILGRRSRRRITRHVLQFWDRQAHLASHIYIRLIAH